MKPASDWLNYHHLRYFWTVAREGSLQRAADRLHVSAPSISAQVRELEGVLGARLFQRSGRRNVLTDAGQMALRYAEEIFGLGGDLLRAMQQRPTIRGVRLYVGIVDSFPKLIIFEILKPAFALPSIHVVCREGKSDDLLAQLAAHRLDIVLADEPARSSVPFRAFNHRLGDSGVTFCAAPPLAQRLRRRFPASLHDAPALLPADNTPLRRTLEGWFRDQGVVPRVVAEFEDLALMKAMATQTEGFVPVPTVVLREANENYGLRTVGEAAGCRDEFYAITAERKITHPVVGLLTERAQRLVFG
ncbi:MAG TPA: LysR family transcriptional regulator [Opitutaceae bacterium]|nr:LysR family transcriptional regulator [Opitutaceae bacterium]